MEVSNLSVKAENLTKNKLNEFNLSPHTKKILHFALDYQSDTNAINFR